jgi:acid stress-induced BolA-like protein IbaG/YrbA
MTEQEVIERIQTQLANAQVLVSGEDCHLTLTIISDAFEGKGLLARHRLIQGFFREELASGSLHALSLNTKTLQEYTQSAA